MLKTVRVATSHCEYHCYDIAAHSSSKFIVLHCRLKIINVVLVGDFPPFITNKGDLIQFGGKLMQKHL